MLGNIFSVRKAAVYSQDTVDILRLIRSENVGPRTFCQLINLFGSAGKALENIEDFSLKGGKKKPIKIYSKESAEAEIEKLEKFGAYLITYKDYNYPQLLTHIFDFPPVLTYKGDITLLNSEKIISIVGARNCSINGKFFTTNLVEQLVSNGYITVSGLARGIDTAVHKASLKNTVAVIAGGIDHIYPQENDKLYKKLTEESLVLSELPIGSSPLAKHFPQRNRIIAGMSLATIVIEAGLKSGSLLTANFAIENNRDVFSVPGFPLDPRYSGSNRLIKQGAYLLETVEDILMNIMIYSKIKNSLKENKHINDHFMLTKLDKNLSIKDTDREVIINLLSSTAVTYDMIKCETKLPLSVIYTICLELELAGRIIRVPGNKISLIY